MSEAHTDLHVVTGAFGYSGRYIARRLLAEGHRVRTLTNSQDRPHPFGDAVSVHPLAFDDAARLVASLRGAKVLYNTYWVRFNHRTFSHSVAIDHSLTLFAAAREAGVERIVHTSITNPSESSPLEYFRGKAILEQALVESGLSYCILRPAVLFGTEDILVNNMAWTLRKLPVVGVFGDGRYRLQPIHVDDFAALAVREGVSRERHVVDATGPETFTYRELFEVLGDCIGRRRPIVCVPHWLGYAVGWLIGALVGDKMITREEIEGLTSDLLATSSPPAGTTRLSDWARAHGDTLGVRYASELARRKPAAGGASRRAA